jgi:hypothetical protein
MTWKEAVGFVAFLIVMIGSMHLGMVCGLRAGYDIGWKDGKKNIRPHFDYFGAPINYKVPCNCDHCRAVKANNE